ncbi:MULTISPECIES: hypothetical protein [unclassified Streptomyces]|uniref:hypothetical protein n=1 Tax=unclassified Streptomyces TaxID=2593676 RepID=UPI003395AA2C
MLGLGGVLGLRWAFGREAREHRDAVERHLNRLKRWRAISKRWRAVTTCSDETGPLGPAKERSPSRPLMRA